MDLRTRTRSIPTPVGAVTVLELSGEVDLHSAPHLRSQLAPLSEAKTHIPRIVVDLGGVSFLDSTGVGTLVRAFKTVRETGGSLVFCHPQGRVQRVLEVTGLLPHLPIYATRDEALRSFAHSETGEPDETGEDSTDDNPANAAALSSQTRGLEASA